MQSEKSHPENKLQFPAEIVKSYPLSDSIPEKSQLIKSVYVTSLNIDISLSVLIYEKVQFMNLAKYVCSLTKS